MAIFLVNIKSINKQLSCRIGHIYIQYIPTEYRNPIHKIVEVFVCVLTVIDRKSYRNPMKKPLTGKGDEKEKY